MSDSEKIIKALKYCIENTVCTNCEFEALPKCNIRQKALKLIEAQGAEIAEQAKRIKELEEQKALALERVNKLKLLLNANYGDGLTFIMQEHNTGKKHFVKKCLISALKCLSVTEILETVKEYLNDENNKNTD